MIVTRIARSTAYRFWGQGDAHLFGQWCGLAICSVLALFPEVGKSRNGVFRPAGEPAGRGSQ
eukprot:1814381-Lingulodinium_polyedra.AAC.1